MNFFLGGGTVEDKVFARKPRTVEDMIQFTLKACQEIGAGKDLCFKACMGVRSRLEVPEGLELLITCYATFVFV